MHNDDDDDDDLCSCYCKDIAHGNQDFSQIIPVCLSLKPCCFLTHYLCKEHRSAKNDVVVVFHLNNNRAWMVCLWFPLIDVVAYSKLPMDPPANDMHCSLILHSTLMFFWNYCAVAHELAPSPESRHPFVITETPLSSWHGLLILTEAKAARQLQATILMQCNVTQSPNLLKFSLEDIYKRCPKHDTRF